MQEPPAPLQVKRRIPIVSGMGARSFRPGLTGSRPRGRRRRLIWTRWAAIAVAALISTGIVLIALAMLRRGVAAFAAAPVWAVVIACALLAAICVRLGIGRWLGFTGLKHISTYPPPWLAGLLGAAAVALTLSLAPSIRARCGLGPDASGPLMAIAMTALGVSAAALVFAACQLAWRTCRRPSEPTKLVEEEPKNSLAAASLHGSFERLTYWLEDDAPVAREDDDAFGHSRIARRIASRLLLERPPAQAVVGPLGSGKTTLRGLVISMLEASGASRYVHIVPVELWPYETSAAAVEGVIGELLDSLACEANIIALRGIPQSYVKAMSSVGGIWSALAYLQGIPKTPFEALERIDAVATAIGHRFVVWVEDLERFAGRGTSADETPEDAERLNPIRALLYGLDRLPSVSVITATTTLQVRFDLEKIARFVEELPALDEGDVGNMISTLRNGCREQFAIIDAADSSARKELDNLGNDRHLQIRRAVQGPGVHSLSDALPALCSTPRTLKQALRSMIDTWRRLPGEVDVDDLLAMSVLREARPDVFALLRDYVPALRSVSRDGSRNIHQTWVEAFNGMRLDDRVRCAADETVKFVFSERSSQLKPQGFMSTRHRDYWERFLAVPVLSETERDQPVLRALLADDDDALLQLLEDPARSGAVEAFSRLLAAERVRRLLVPLVTRRAKEIPSRWSETSGWPQEDSGPPGLIPLWRIWLHRSRHEDLDPTQALEEVRHALETAVPGNLYLAALIEEYFVLPLDDSTKILGDRIGEAKTHLRELVVSTYVEKPAALANALVGAPPFTLLWVCWGLDRIRAKNLSGEPFPSWSSFAQTILDATRLRPAELIPQLACLVASESTILTRENLAHAYEFDAGTATNLFGGVEAIFDVFEPHDPAQWVDDGRVQAVFIALKKRDAQRQSASAQPSS